MAMLGAPIQVGGIYYNFDNATQTATVTYKEPRSSNDYSGLIVIPNTVTYSSVTYSVTSIGSYAFSGCSSLTRITIPNSVTSIGTNAFKDCTSLTTITIPNSVTSFGAYPFSGCTSLPVDNNIRYADTYLVEVVDKTLSTYIIKEGTKCIGDHAFYGCTDLTSIEIPNSVIIIWKNAFERCKGLTSLTIPASVTSIGKGLQIYGKKCNPQIFLKIPYTSTAVLNSLRNLRSFSK